MKSTEWVALREVSVGLLLFGPIHVGATMTTPCFASEVDIKVFFTLFCEQMEPTAGEEVYKGPLDCARRMVREEGVGSLFKGGIARVMRVSPQFGITLCIYDMLNK